MLDPQDFIKIEYSEEEPGFKVTDFVSYPAEKVIEPATPGKAYSPA